MEKLNGATHTVAGLITARMVEIDERIAELRQEKLDLHEARRVVTGSRAGQGAPGKAGRKGARKPRNWTEFDSKRLKAIATKFGSDHFGAAEIAKVSKAEKQSITSWITHASQSGMFVRVERGVYRLSAKGQK